MKKYSQLVLWSIFSVLMVQTISAKEVLSADFDPTTVKTESDERIIQANIRRGEKLDATTDEIYKLLKKSDDYEKMHPILKKWVDQNKENFFQVSPSYYILYRDADVGAEVNFTIGQKDKVLLHFNRTYFKSPEDAAFEYKQTPAINPTTKKPWINVDKNEVKRIIQNTKQKFSKEDSAYLTDLLGVLNENFHFYYGEPFVILKGNVKDKSTLIGKYKPLRVLAYDAFDEFLPPESEQKRELSKKLGRAVYPFYKMIDNSKMLRATLNCGDKGTINIKLKDGQDATLTYWNQVNPARVDETMYARATQLADIPWNFGQMSNALSLIMQEKGVDVENQKNNRTPLTQVLYLINLKAQNYLEAVATSEYVQESKNAVDFGKYKKLSEAVPLPTQLKPIKKLQKNYN